MNGFLPSVSRQKTTIMPSQTVNKYKKGVGMPQNQCGLANTPSIGKLNKTRAMMKTAIKREALRDIFFLNDK